MGYNVKAWDELSKFKGLYAYNDDKGWMHTKYLHHDGNWHVGAGSNAVFKDLDQIKEAIKSAERKKTTLLLKQKETELGNLEWKLVSVQESIIELGKTLNRI